LTSFDVVFEDSVSAKPADFRNASSAPQTEDAPIGDLLYRLIAVS
jgi:hypothetical protein